MKKIVLLASFVGVSIFANAQTSQGNIAIGGTLGITSSGGKTTTTAAGTSESTDAPKTTSFTVLPNVSYFISDKFAIGLGIGYGGSSTSTPTSTPTAADPNAVTNLKSSNGTFNINPFAKYYISTGDKSAFLIKGGVNLGFGTNRSQSYKSGTAFVGGVPVTTPASVVNNDPVKTTSIGFGIAPGFLFFPADNFGVELSLGSNLLGYTTSTDKTTGTGYEKKETNNSFELLGVNTLGVGVSVFYFIK